MLLKSCGDSVKALGNKFDTLILLPYYGGKKITALHDPVNNFRESQNFSGKSLIIFYANPW